MHNFGVKNSASSENQVKTMPHFIALDGTELFEKNFEFEVLTLRSLDGIRRH